MLDLLAGPSLQGLAGGGGGLFSDRTPGATAIGVLGSRTVQDDIIKRYNLRSVYHSKLDIDARKTLAGETAFEEDKKTGIIAITVTDDDRYLARNIAQSYIDELNTLISTLSTSSARKERIFLGERLKAVKADLDASSLALSQFSSKNATFDPVKQAATTAEASSKLQGEMITAESELSSLKAMYADDNVRVRAVRARIDTLQSQLQAMSGQGEGASSSRPATRGIISLSPPVTFTRLYILRSLSKSHHKREYLRNSNQAIRDCQGTRSKRDSCN